MAVNSIPDQDPKIMGNKVLITDPKSDLLLRLIMKNSLRAKKEIKDAWTI